VYFYIFEYDYLFEPAPVDIKLEKGKIIKFDFYVELSCVYKVGIRFMDEHGNYENIHKYFGKKLSQTNLQARIDIRILNSRKELVFEKQNLGESKSYIQYGPNPIGFIAGTPYLTPGEYSAIINVKELRRDYSYFDIKFFVEMDRKIKCT
jgi:hypothetical protein